MLVGLFSLLCLSMTSHRAEMLIPVAFWRLKRYTSSFSVQFFYLLKELQESKIWVVI